MTAFKLENFGGIRPRISKRLLPPNAAVTAENTKLLEGELRGFHNPSILSPNITTIQDSGTSTGRAYRIPASITGTVDVWLAFQSLNTDIIRSPVLGDAYSRYYWASDVQAPQYNTLSNIVAGSGGPYLLGVPQTTTPSSVTDNGSGGSGETRSYIYTAVSAYGEEGPPCNPITYTASGANATTWTLHGLLTTSWSGLVGRDITSFNIYRTVPNASNPGFFFVANVAISSSTTYADSSTNTTIVLNNTIQYVDNFPPPSTLEGFALMPQGYMIGWVNNELYFTEPYLPHAWNPTYSISTEFNIVGIVIWSQTAIICTQSNVYMGSGATPDAFTMQKLDGVTPCLSRRGIVSTVAGAYFPTVDGLAMLNTNGLNIITQDILTKEEWATFNPSSIFAAQLGLQYIAFTSANTGFLINPTENSAKMATITAFSNVTGIETDRYTGNVTILLDSLAYVWDPNGAERLYWHWVSKEVQFPQFVNLGAYKVKADFGSSNVTTNITAVYGPYDTGRFGAVTAGTPSSVPPYNATKNPLNPMGMNMMGGISPYRLGLVSGNQLPENRMPMGGSQLYPLTALSSQGLYVHMIVYCNEIKIADQIITNDKINRLPSGFKHDIWQFEMYGNTDVYSVQFGETGKDLAKV